MSGAELIADIGGHRLSDEDRDFLSRSAVGGLILFSRNYQSPQQLANLLAEIKDLRPDILLCVDHEGGRVQRFREGFTVLPPMQRLGQLHRHKPDEASEFAVELGWLMAGELLEHGIDLSFAPVVDLDESRSTIIGDRAFSPMPAICVELAAAFVKGMGEAGMQATLKHFPGHGSVVADSHLELPVDDRSFAEIEDYDLIPFRELCPLVGAVMTAHVLYAAVDPHPASFSRYWLQNVLRERLGFRGLIFSDDLSMGGAQAIGAVGARAEQALEAGCDFLVACNDRAAALEICAMLEKTNSTQSAGPSSRLMGKNKGDRVRGTSRWLRAKSIAEQLR